MPVPFSELNPTRVIAAVTILLAYGGLSAYWLRALWRQRPLLDVQPATTLIAYASQTGFAQQLATQTAQSLQTANQSVRIAPLGELSASDIAKAERALFIVSTTGEGDAPDPAASFVRRELPRTVSLSTLHYGLLALGDREYANFCAFGHQLDGWLRHQGAQSLFDVIEVDNGDEGALRRWQHHLSLVFDAPDLPDWETPAYGRWRLIERRLLNPHSAGDPCFHIVLEPTEPSDLRWQAGDIAEIDPCNSHDDAGERHPHREYSIASIADDGALHLLVRQMRRPGGELGLGSGWLTEGAPLNGEIALRARANPNFRLFESDAPLILIGNGTGLAGLRALLKTRVSRGQRRNWLLFGERHAAHDSFYSDELQAWHRKGFLPQLDLVFSRDQSERRYVQHRLIERADELRRWIADGAYIYVCGSLAGMAPGVHSALLDALGEKMLENLTETGRYRRDVY